MGIKNELYKLYLECFPQDSEHYAKYFIRNKYQGDNVVYSSNENGEIVSMLFILDSVLKVGESQLKGGFFSAVGTKLSERKKGYAQKNLITAMTKLKSEGCLFATLYPERHSFYEKIGFSTYAFTEKISIDKRPLQGVRLDERDAQSMLELYNDYAEKNAYVYAKRTLEDMEKRVDEFLTEGEVVGYFEEGEIKAYAMYFDKGEVDEVAYVDEAYLQKLAISNYRRPAFLGRPEGMIRVLDIIGFLKAIDFMPEFIVDMRIKYVDGIFEDNNVIVKLIVKDRKANVEVLQADAEFDVEYEVGDFASVVLRSGQNLTLEKF